MLSGSAHRLVRVARFVFLLGDRAAPCLVGRLAAVESRRRGVADASGRVFRRRRAGIDRRMGLPFGLLLGRALAVADPGALLGWQRLPGWTGPGLGLMRGRLQPAGHGVTAPSRERDAGPRDIPHPRDVAAARVGILRLQGR